MSSRIQVQRSRSRLRLKSERRRWSRSGEKYATALWIEAAKCRPQQHFALV